MGHIRSIRGPTCVFARQKSGIRNKLWFLSSKVPHLERGRVVGRLFRRPKMGDLSSAEGDLASALSKPILPHNPYLRGSTEGVWVMREMTVVIHATLLWFGCSDEGAGCLTVMYVNKRSPHSDDLSLGKACCASRSACAPTTWHWFEDPPSSRGNLSCRLYLEISPKAYRMMDDGAVMLRLFGCCAKQLTQ